MKVYEIIVEFYGRQNKNWLLSKLVELTKLGIERLTHPNWPFEVRFTAL